MNAPIWLVDAGPLTTLASEYDASWQWPGAALHITATVEREALPDRTADPLRTPRGRLLAQKTLDGIPWIQVHSLDAAQAMPIMKRLSGLPRVDPGELESIAWCATVASEATFVTQDKSAAFLALGELGPGRVALPFDLWVDLFRRALINRPTLRKLCESTPRGLNGALPGSAPPRLGLDPEP